MSCGELQRRVLELGSVRSVCPRDLQTTQEFRCGGQQALAGHGQSHRMSRAIKQARADPVLEGLDPSAKGGLADGAALCRAREAALFDNRQKIFKPCRVHSESCSALTSLSIHGTAQQYLKRTCTISMK